MPTVTYVSFAGDRTCVEVEAGENVMRGAIYNGIEGIVGECGGGLACATCHCYVDEAWLDRVGAAPTQAERDMLNAAAAPTTPSSRLSCQIVVDAGLDGLVVHLPQTQF